MGSGKVLFMNIENNGLSRLMYEGNFCYNLQNDFIVNAG